MTRGFVVALLGAESTGKTTLARGLQPAMGHEGRRVAVVDEFLREFCDRVGRTPRLHEQGAIADVQTHRIEAAARDHALVIADTTALMTAVYSDWVFGDTGLYAAAQRAHSRYDLTLLTALDIAWEADGLQRDGPQVREPVDALIRAALARMGADYAVIAGRGSARLAAAVAGIERAMAPKPDVSAPSRWHWQCDRCGDAACERRPLLPPLSPPFLPPLNTDVCGSGATSLSSPNEKNMEIGGCPKPA